MSCHIYNEGVGEPLVTLKKSALIKNAHALLKHQSKSLFPVLKANAYGHGSIWAARVLESEFLEPQIPMFCVARAGEAWEILESGIKRRVLILSHWSLEELVGPTDSISLCVSTWDDLRLLESVPPPKCLHSIHIKINTGMNRLGFSLDDTQDSGWISTLKNLQTKGYRVNGIMSHLACGELDPEVFSQQQAKSFDGVVSKLVSLGFGFQWIHFENGAGSLWHQGIRKGPWNAVRPGLALYGIDPRNGVADSLWLEPVLKVSGPLRQTIRVPAGESIGYGRTYRCSTDHVVGIVSLGYADGLDRMLSRSEGQDWIVGLTWKESRIPFVGKISMDLCAVDLSSIAEYQRPHSGQHLEWIGAQQSVSEIAKATGRISWEILCSIDHRLKRVEVDL